MKRSFLIVGAGLVALSLAGCGSTDVVAKMANSSFKAVAQASKDRISYSETDGSWVLASEAGDQVFLATDFSKTPDVKFSFDAAPLIAAGLDSSRLIGPEGVSYALEGGRLVVRFELGADQFPAEAKKSLESTFAEIVKTQRQRIGYHEKLDHYGIKLGGGNMFEWAKDLSKNDKDIVWALNPAPFIAAGLDPAKVQGWLFAKVESKDAKGKTVVEDKLLKPFNLL